MKKERKVWYFHGWFGLVCGGRRSVVVKKKGRLGNGEGNRLVCSSSKNTHNTLDEFWLNNEYPLRFDSLSGLANESKRPLPICIRTSFELPSHKTPPGFARHNRCRRYTLCLFSRLGIQSKYPERLPVLIFSIIVHVERQLVEFEMLGGGMIRQGRQDDRNRGLSCVLVCNRSKRPVACPRMTVQRC